MGVKKDKRGRTSEGLNVARPRLGSHCWIPEMDAFLTSTSLMKYLESGTCDVQTCDVRTLVSGVRLAVCDSVC